ncbi:MAG: DUF2723 domain-containing protein [Ignavibacteriales bacterium]|nr:DUF2723 domain-containing protein [Ignavibacteriales bacterium]
MINRTILLLTRHFKIIVSTIVLIIYIYTLAPTVVQIDSGELAATQYFLGITHPTGYPLFTIIGWLFVHIPFPASKVYLSNLLAAFWTAGGVFYFMALLEILSKKFHTELQKKQLSTKKLRSGLDKHVNNIYHSYWIIITIAVNGFYFAFNKIIWLQSTSVEVYSLHIMLLTGLIYSCFKIMLNQSERSDSFNVKEIISQWWHVPLFLGLGIGNHLSIVFAIPGLVVFYFIVKRFDRNSIFVFLFILLSTLGVATILYLFLIFRAGHGPEFNWGEPSTFSSLLYHIEGKQYSDGFFRSIEATEFNLEAFFRTLPIVFGFAPLVFLPFSLIYLRKVSKTVSVILIILFITNLFLAINYKIYDLMTYFILCYLVMHVLIYQGVVIVGEYLKLFRNGVYIFFIFLFTILIIEVSQNIGVSHRNLYTFEDYSKNLLSSLPENSVIFSSVHHDWEYLTSPLFYFQRVENIRKDIIPINAGLLGMPWYIHQLSKWYPGLFNECKKEVADFEESSKNFDADISDLYKKEVLNLCYKNLLNALINSLIKTHQVYFSYNFVYNEFGDFKIVLSEKHAPIPELFLYKIVKNPTIYSPFPKVKINIRYPEIQSEYIGLIKNSTANILYERATIYERFFKHIERGDSILKLMNSNFPSAEIIHRNPFGN